MKKKSSGHARSVTRRRRKPGSQVTFTSRLSAAATALNHAWEHTVGSSRALLALRADWQAQLQRCHDEIGFPARPLPRPA